MRQEPLYAGGFRSYEELTTFVYHQKSIAKAKFASNCVERLASHRPASWPEPTTIQEFVDQIEVMIAAPRKFGTFVTGPEARAVAFTHALFRRQWRDEARDA